MFSRLYNTGIAAYGTLLRLVAPVNAKARLWVDGQQGLLGRIADALPDRQLPNAGGPLAWFHAASLGEFEQGRPVIEAFRKQYPDYRILLTFFSPSGYEVRKNYDGADYVCYLPADTPQNARQFVTLVRPDIAFFIKYEFWANYLRELKNADVPVVSFSAIFRPDQLFFKPYGGFYRAMLRQFDHILVQNPESVALLAGIGVEPVTLAGDTRFDRVAQVAATAVDLPVVRAFKAGPDTGPMPLLVVGSAWPADMDVLIPFLNQFVQPLKVIVAPHEIRSEQIERWRKQLSRPSVRYSETQQPTFDPATLPATSMLFIDNIGMLSSLYQYGEFAYIGGAFGEGLHNILEAATFGMPVFFGPEYDTFQEAVDLVQAGAAFPVRTMDALTNSFVSQYQNRSEAARISHEYVQRNIGATAKVMEVVRAIFARRDTRG